MLERYLLIVEALIEIYFFPLDINIFLLIFNYVALMSFTVIVSLFDIFLMAIFAILINVIFDHVKCTCLLNYKALHV